MCGRFALTASPEQVRALFRYEEQPNFPPRANVAPTEPIAIVTQERGRPAFRLVRWGFIPAWAKDPGAFPLLINARGETLAEKPAFRNAIRRRRCLVPADAYYEWSRGPGAARRPHRISRRDGATMALAALWETYVSPDGGEIDTALIVTTHANGAVCALQERMPVVIEPGDARTWLDCVGEDPRAALTLVRPCADDLLAVEPCDPSLPAAERARLTVGGTKAARPSPPRREPEPPAQGSLF
ncbi:SOS response-associated peptidase [Alsobacter sp. KACC 23698]|uniref:Abasic site processing protein n=1 Tax=Alsobacter sp. KACC 23698 TaxID=3149229 RepID=A0AAU7JJV6_9HYPH